MAKQPEHRAPVPLLKEDEQQSNEQSNDTRSYLRSKRLNLKLPLPASQADAASTNNDFRTTVVEAIHLSRT